ncbi:MAG: biopolymer transporter ExbD, partial [Leptolyngbyaceae cyanobacterium RM2_2_21]|nr:biopolymer transporter ExbD [Leptolyngbyaceae cyanobacterium RM2_2_21]
LNREAISLGDLSSAIKNQIEPGQPVLVTISADEAVSHGQVVAAMDELRQIDQVRIGIATKPIN